MRPARPILFDFFACQFGAGKGYHDAGFDVIGFDIEPQPRAPLQFVRADALVTLRMLLDGHPIAGVTLERVAAFHASPPCQHDSATQRIQGNDHPDLIEMVRALLERTGKPYVIENVEGAVLKLREPKMLCAAMFGRGPTPTAVGLDRHRYFETNWPLEVPEHPAHTWRTTKMGRPPKPGEAMHVVGNFSGVSIARELMAMPWASRDGLREAIPPYYTEFIGRQLMEAIR
jgi:DNA (cytosine-5)-methyltransferase 1